MIVAFLIMMPTAAAAAVPLIPDPERPIVEALIGGDPVPRHFIVDTAASATVLDRSYAAEHKLPLSSKAITVQGASGGASFATATLDRLRVGPVLFTDRSVVLTDTARYRGNRPYLIDGVIGSDMFGTHGIRFDPLAGRLEMRFTPFPAGACVANRSGSAIAGLTIVDALLSANGHRVAARAVIDSGAPQTIINFPALRSLGLTLESPEVHRSTILTKGFSSASTGRETWELRLDGGQIAKWTTGPFTTRVNDAPIFAVLGAADRPGVIIGYDLLKQARFGASEGLKSFCIAAPPTAREARPKRG